MKSCETIKYDKPALQFEYRPSQKAILNNWESGTWCILPILRRHISIADFPDAFYGQLENSNLDAFLSKIQMSSDRI